MDTRRTLCVLVVDDCPDQVNTLALLLNLWDHQTLVAGDGPAALETALVHRPDVVLLDLGLPGNMDGYEVARQLRARPETALTLLVAVTGYGQDRDRQRAHDAGFNHFLLKPSDPQELKKLLDDYAGLALDSALPDPRRGVPLAAFSSPTGADDRHALQP